MYVELVVQCDFYGRTGAAEADRRVNLRTSGIVSVGSSILMDFLYFSIFLTCVLNLKIHREDLRYSLL
jgi:hypothetical protein